MGLGKALGREAIEVAGWEVGELAARRVVALDTNAIIAAVEHGQETAVLQGRLPVIPIAAVKEFLQGGGLPAALREFLVRSGGRLALAGSEAIGAALQQQAAALGRVLRTNDARIVAGAMREGMPLITNDVRLRNFLRAIGFPVEGF